MADYASPACGVALPSLFLIFSRREEVWCMSNPHKSRDDQEADDDTATEVENDGLEDDQDEDLDEDETEADESEDIDEDDDDDDRPEPAQDEETEPSPPRQPERGNEDNRRRKPDDSNSSPLDPLGRGPLEPEIPEIYQNPWPMRDHY